MIALIAVAAISTQASAETIIRSQSAEIVRHFMDKDMTDMIRHVHPDHGVRFSPTPHLSESDMRFTHKQMLNLFKDRTVYTWGALPGSDTPLRSTFADYYTKYVYARDFSQATELSYNKAARGGMVGNNSTTFFEGSRFIDYHFPETAPDAKNWHTLRLVFMPWRDNWLLVAVVNDQAF